MKKNFLYIGLIAFCIAAVGFVVVRYKDKQATEKSQSYPFLNRNQNNSIAEWEFAKKNADQLMLKLKENPDDIKSLLALANAYIMEGRISGNYAYYDKAAYKTIAKILDKKPNQYDALLLKSLLQLSQHHFAEGLSTAQLCAGINPNNAFVYGLLVDANIEMGNYADALDAADKMVSIRPDIRSYSRIAYLREIHGDYQGAIDAMKLAVTAGVPSEESTEWCRVQLGRLYEHVGQIDKAEYQYKLSLAARPAYANALNGMARIATHKNKTDSAIIFLEQASTLINDLDIRQNLATAYQRAGNSRKAEQLFAELLKENANNASLAVDDPEAGHYSDKEIAYLYIQLNKKDEALEHALAEYNRRPKNIDVNEMMAWIHYKRDEIKKAMPYVEQAMRTGSKNPTLLTIAGLVNYKSGNIAKGKLLLEEARNNQPVMPATLVAETKELLAKI